MSNYAKNVETICELENTTQAPLEIISNARETLDYCLDSRGLSILMKDKQLWGAITGLKKRGIRSRYVTEITEGNTHICNLIMAKCGEELFHNDRVRGNFMIVDGTKYLCYILNDDCKEDQLHPVKQLLHTQLRPFVDTQQYLFDNLCVKAIPAREKIREIERGIRGNFTEKIQDSLEIQKIAIELINTATYEVLLLFSTINSFYRLEYTGILNSLWEASSQRNVAVKVLIQTDSSTDDTIRETIQKRIRQNRLPISIQYITKSLQTKITTLVIDQAISLAIDIKDDTKETFEEASGMAIYSNNESTVSSCLSIFETLWIQSEFDKQNIIKQAYFDMFKGFKLKDEVYTRRWSFEQKNEKRS
jgi:hypothetical protein